MKLKKLGLLFGFVLLISMVYADTTFFDNPDDSFIISNPVTGEIIIGGTTDGTASAGGCLYEWNCTNWGECFISGKQTRNCTNIGTCLNTYKTPEKEQNCTYTVPETKKEGTEKIKDLIWLEVAIGVLVIGAVLFIVINKFKKVRKRKK